MDIKKYIEIEMTKIRNSPTLEQPKKIELLTKEAVRLGHNPISVNILISENIVAYMKKLAKELRKEG